MGPSGALACDQWGAVDLRPGGGDRRGSGVAGGAAGRDRSAAGSGAGARRQELVRDQRGDPAGTRGVCEGSSGRRQRIHVRATGAQHMRDVVEGRRVFIC